MRKHPDPKHPKPGRDAPKCVADGICGLGPLEFLSGGGCAGVVFLLLRCQTAPLLNPKPTPLHSIVYAHKAWYRSCFG